MLILLVVFMACDHRGVLLQLRGGREVGQVDRAYFTGRQLNCCLVERTGEYFFR